MVCVEGSPLVQSHHHHIIVHRGTQSIQASANVALEPCESRIFCATLVLLPRVSDAASKNNCNLPIASWSRAPRRSASEHARHRPRSHVAAPHLGYGPD